MESEVVKRPFSAHVPTPGVTGQMWSTASFYVLNKMSLNCVEWSPYCLVVLIDHKIYHDEFRLR